MTNPKIVLSKIVNFNRSKSFRTTSALILTTLMLVVAAATATARTYTDLYNFGFNSGDPSKPQGPLAQGRDGNLYGVSYTGGTHNLGTVFLVTPAGTQNVLYDFDGTHGANPWGGLTLGRDGNFYGTTSFGGTLGHGTVFRINPAGQLTVLHSFTNGSDGSSPWAPPVQGTDGNFYGTTGGPLGAGTVYKMTRSGSPHFTSLLTTRFTPGQIPRILSSRRSTGRFMGRPLLRAPTTGAQSSELPRPGPSHQFTALNHEPARVPMVS
jgi:uncharacterized repeat protein (TIGR03803 family)